VVTPPYENIARGLVMDAPDHGTNPDAGQPQGPWGGKGPQTSRQRKRENVRDDKGGCVRLLPARENVFRLDIATPGPCSR
jgi:hypothetical protein